MTARLLGVALLVLGGALCGWQQLERRRRKERLLGELRAALERMADEIRQLSRPMGEIFALLAQNSPTLHVFFHSLARDTGQQPLGKLWQEALGTLPLAEAARENLAVLGNVLGRYDAESQARHIALVCRRLEQQREELSRDNAVKCRLFPGLGACLGGMLAVILM